MRKSLLFMAILLFSLFLLAACGSDSSSKSKGSGTDGGKGSSEENAEPQSGGTITVGSQEEPDTLDVHKTSMSIANLIATSFGGSLLAINPETNELEPYLAEEYEVSDDGKTITFKIREGVAFSDGTPLTAQTYKDTFDRIYDPETGAVVAASLAAGIKETSAPDDHTFIIELEEPSAPLMRNLGTAGYLQPLSMAAIEEHGDDYGRNPVGVGPYIFKDWDTGQSITLERNEDFAWPQPYYKNKGKAYPDQLVYKFIPDDQTMLAALDSGSIDIAIGVAPKDVQKYRDNDDYYILEVDRQGLGLFLEMNTENEVLSDPNVRKAINMAINKDSIIQAELSGEGTPAYGPIPETIFGYDPEVENYGHHFNKDEAVELLESAGYKQNGEGIMEKDGEKLTFDLSVMDAHNQPAQMVQAMLKEIGIEVEIQSMEAGTLIEKVAQGEYDMSFLAYSYEDPDFLFLAFHSSQLGGLNHARVQNPELDELLEKGRITLDPEERKQIYADAQKIIVEEAYWAPIYAEKVFVVVNSRVKDAMLNNTTLNLHDSWVSQE